jgi:hypothetical protein
MVCRGPGFPGSAIDPAIFPLTERSEVPPEPEKHSFIEFIVCPYHEIKLIHHPLSSV